jgi:retinol-binding protein 3
MTGRARLKAKPSHLLILLAFVNASALAQTPSPPAGVLWTLPERQQALARAESALNDYFYPDRIAALRAVIEANRRSLLQIADQQIFATVLTNELQTASGDKHIIVWYSATPIGEKRTAKRTESTEARRFFSHVDYGFTAAIRLAGNIGYLNLGGFADMPLAKRTLDAAMTLLSPTDALIIDLRGNGGGDSDTVAYLLGYFFSHPTEVTGAVVREGGKFHTDHTFTPAHVGGPRYVDKPLYVLISQQTISGGEMVAYDLKTLHRAVVLGQASAGAAMGLGSPPYFLTKHLTISVPNAQTRNPYTGTNWQSTGVVPDIAVPSQQALLAAYERALKAANDSYDPMNELPAALQDPAAALRASLP